MCDGEGLVKTVPSCFSHREQGCAQEHNTGVLGQCSARGDALMQLRSHNARPPTCLSQPLPINATAASPPAAPHHQPQFGLLLGMLTRVCPLPPPSPPPAFPSPDARETVQFGLLGMLMHGAAIESHHWMREFSAYQVMQFFNIDASGAGVCLPGYCVVCCVF